MVAFRSPFASSPVSGKLRHVVTSGLLSTPIICSYRKKFGYRYPEGGYIFFDSPNQLHYFVRYTRFGKTGEPSGGRMSVPSRVQLMKE